MKNEIGMGVLCFFTFGLFGIGWIIDVVKECKKWPDSKQVASIKYILMILCFLMALVEIEYSFLSFFLLMICGISIVDFIWGKLNFTNKIFRICVPILLFLVGISLGLVLFQSRCTELGCRNR
mgnify:CR=1 FL=1